MNRVILGTTVYYPIKEVCEHLKLTEEEFRANYFNELHAKEWNNIDLISEVWYNTVLRDNDSLFRVADGIRQITKVDTIEAELEAFTSCMAMVRAIFGERFINDNYLEKEYQDIVKKLTDTEKPGEADKYNEQFKLYEEIYNPICDKYGLRLQYLTVLDPTAHNRHLSLQAYLAGDGIFYDVPCDFDYYEPYDNTEVDENGNLLVHYVDKNDEEQVEVLKKLEGRDFREHTALQNLIWCIQNVTPDCGLVDEYGFNDGAVVGWIPLTVLYELVNKKGFGTEIYSGVIEVKQC